MKNIINAALMTLLSVTGGCTVKEDRSACPCNLTVLFTGSSSTRSDVSLIGWDSQERFKDNVDVNENGPLWSRTVDKGLFTLSCYRGKEALTEGHYSIIPEGKQADSLYAYHTLVNATGENASAEVSFFKQFATVYIDIRKSAVRMQDFTFTVRGNTCGTDLLDFSPVKGVFSYSATASKGNWWVSFRIPRQIDNGLVLNVKENNGRDRDYPLGEVIAAKGYDWDELELSDIYIMIDLVFSSVSVSIGVWEEGSTTDEIEL